METGGKGKFQKYRKFQFVMSMIAGARVFQKLYKWPVKELFFHLHKRCEDILLIKLTEQYLIYMKTPKTSFITQSKHIFSWNEMFIKAYDLLFLGKDFGCGLCWSYFCLQNVLKEQFTDFFSELQHYNISYW